jgi:hemin uptake protein HemP
MIEREAPAVATPDAPRRQPEDKPLLAGGRRIVKSGELFGGGHVLLIDHRGEIYSLRETSKGKLILTK